MQESEGSYSAGENVFFACLIEHCFQETVGGVVYYSMSFRLRIS